DAWRAEFGDEAERPRWAELLRSGVDIFDLYYDAILAAMYALSVSPEGDCYLYVPRDPSIEAATLGASESALPGTAPAEALHTFTLDSGASRCFFRDSTTLTPLSAPVPVRLADPSGGPVLARSSTVLLCLAVSYGSLSGLHLPSFSTNLVSIAALQDAMVTTTTPGGQRVSICTCIQTGCHLATSTCRPGSSLYTLATEPPQVAASAQVSASGPVAPPCSCRLLSHQTLLWHHHLGHPSLPRLRGMHSRLLGRERYFLLVVDDYTRYTTVFPLRSKGGEFSSNLLREFCRGEGILQSFTLPASPQQNGIAERRIGLVMEVARTSMIHAAAPHFLLSFAVWYATHQLNLWPHVSLPETSPTLRWTGKVGDASVFRVWGSRAFVRNTSADKLSTRAIPCIFLGFPPDAPGWKFYHPTSCRVLPSLDVKLDESVPFYRLFPYRSAPLPSPLLFLAPGPPLVDPLPPQGPAPSGVSQVDPLPSTVPIEVAVDSGAARGPRSGDAASGGAEPASAEPGGAESKGAGSGGAELGGAEPGGAEPEGAEPGGAESEVAESGGAEPRRTASSAGPAGASPQLSSRLEPLSLQQLREWFARCTRLRSGAAEAGDSATGGTGAGGARDTSLGGARVPAGAGGPGGAGAAGPQGARPRGTGAAGASGAAGAGAGDTGAGGARAGGTGASGRGGTAGAGAGGAAGVGVGGSRAAGPRGARTGGTRAAGAGGAAGVGAGGTGAGAAGSAGPGGTGAVGGGTGRTSLRTGRRTLNIPTPHSYAEAITGPYSSQWQTAMDTEMASWKSTGAYVDAVPPPEANIVNGIAIFRVKRPSGSPPAFKARYPARGDMAASPTWLHLVVSYKYPVEPPAASLWSPPGASRVVQHIEDDSSSLVLYVDNKAMIALCQEHRLEHRTKHITLRYFLARELQQRGQLRLAYVVTQANTADVFTEAL
ncbi:unnamed protein product, partial [Closterium sp. NIES-53]